MKHSDFVHLHVHTQYSLLDGAIRLKDLFKEAKKNRMPALAMTDHGNMFGAIEFYQKAYRHGIKPIIGCELYVAKESRFIKKAQDANHLIVLVRNMTGYKNLIKLTSAGYLEGFYYRPRIDKKLLSENSDGLIGMSACLHGEIPHFLLNGDKESAKRAAEEYLAIFGEGNFYLEIMENGLPEQGEVNKGLIAMGKELSIPVVATNDCHYLKKEDSEAHDVLLCIQTGKTIEDDDRMRFKTDHLYFKSPEEMMETFDYCPEAIENTVKIAERCNLTLDLNQTLLPNYRKIEKGVSPGDYLEEKAKKGLQELMPLITKGGREELREIYEKRLISELDIIKSMGFPGYFLIVSDFVDHAKEKNIPVGPGRGSVAGSLVAYALGITSVDPIKYGLFFERFLNPDRMSMPDIDIDFCIEGRDDIINYVTAEYGSDRVAQIITFGKMQAKAVVRDVGRAMNIPYGEVDRIAKLIPNVLNITLEEAIKRESRLREESNNNEKIKKLLSLSMSLEGLNRHASTHAAGVVISDKPLLERVPLYKSPNNDDVVTQYSMNDLQTAGLTKFDFLGLKTLTVIKNTLIFIKEGRGEEIDINNISLDDPLTYQLLVKGQTDGVFQLESAGMKELLVSMKPDRIEDLIALISLYRPGPMNMVSDFIARKQGKKKIDYETPQLENILKETYGIILYQEQV
ncbi:MAG: DNA polymerase III subunit alpha, partial [Syntrophaceae bacterium]|nr:DNA polymerase III subunit alpha [Syntrophaceae bacterium]